MATSNYPGSLDDYSSLPSSGTPITVSSHYFGPAITNIEAELGTDPAGYATDLKTRLSDINPSEGNLNLDAGYGSKAPIYGVRAWVNFDGTTNVSGNCTIRASANVSSVADNGTGKYTVNFTSAMPDANYSVVLTTVAASSTDNTRNINVAGASGSGASNKITSAVSIFSGVTNTTSSAVDSAEINVSVFR